ncbi:MAG: hypothetical protein Fur0039_05160 [Rhodocyclaceae bacterium]
MKFSHLLLAAGIAMTGSATAADYTWGDLTGTAVAATIYQPSAGLFEDHHFFGVTTPSAATAVISDIAIMPLLNIDSLTAGVYEDLGTVGAADPADSLLAALGASDTIVGSVTLPASGAYYVKVTGVSTGAGFELSGSPPPEHGAYFFDFATVPVPEAETWAMLLAGLGFLFLKLRRSAS